MNNIIFKNGIATVAVFKYNPYHDSRGRFSSSNGAASFSLAGGRAGKMAIEREKEKAKVKSEQGSNDSWIKSLSPEEKQAIIRYQSNNLEFNEFLRTGNKFSEFGPQATPKEYRHLDEAISRSRINADTTLYRGTSTAMFKNHSVKGSIGKVISDKGYMSTSTQRNSAEMYAEDVLLKINAPKGTKGAKISGLDAKFKENHEILLPRNTSYKILSVKEIKGNTGVSYEVEAEIV